MFLLAPVQGKPKIQFTSGSQLTEKDVQENNSDEDNASEASASTNKGGEQLENDILPAEKLVPPEGVPCQFCDKVFVSHSTLLKHKSKHHPDVVGESHSQQKSPKASGKETVIVQNIDGTSVITVPPEFWKNDVLEKSEKSDGGETILDGDKDDNDIAKPNENSNDDDNDEEDIINSLHDVMNDFIGDNKECEVIECSADEFEEVEEEKEEENAIQNEYTSNRSKLKERNRVRKKKNDADEPMVKKVKRTKESEKETATTRITEKITRQKIISEVIEIDSDDSKSDTEGVEQSSEMGEKFLDVSSSSLYRGEKSKRVTTSSRKAEMTLSVTDKIDKNMQTIPTTKLSTNTSKAGKILTCLGIFKSGKVDSVNGTVWADIQTRSKNTQTGKRNKGKVIYSSPNLPIIKTEDPQIYDCTFHKYCIANKIKFHTKDELTKHIVLGFKNQPHIATERRASSSYHRQTVNQPVTSKTVQAEKQSRDSNESSESSEERFYTKEELGKKIVSGLLSSSSGTKRSEEKEYDCPVCSSQFSNRRSLYQHLQSDHSQAMISNGAGRITGQGHTSHNQRKARTHRDKIPNFRRLPEKEGDKILLSTKELTEVVYPCPVCKAIFYHDFELESHIKSEHKENDDGSEINSDAAAIGDVSNPVASMMTRVATAGTSDDEDQSDERASTSAVPQVQQAGMARCPMCPSNLAMFGNVNDLQVHLTETHGVQAKVVNLAEKKGAENSMSKYGGHYECPVCALLFSTSADMYAHLNGAHMKQVRKSWKLQGRGNHTSNVQQNIFNTETG